MNNHNIPAKIFADKIAELENYVTSTTIFLDASSWMQPSIEEFEDNLVPLLWKHSASVIVPVCIYDEIRSKLNCGKPESEKCADRALRVMGRMQNAGLIRFYKDEDDNFGDSMFDSLFRKKWQTHRLMLITNDYNLAATVRSINDVDYCFGFPIVVKALGDDGWLTEIENIRKKPHIPQPQQPKSQQPKPQITAQPTPKPQNITGFSIRARLAADDNDSQGKKKSALPSLKRGSMMNVNVTPAFEFTQRLTAVPDTPIPVSKIPGAGETVTASGHSIRITEKLGEGGEGCVYRTNFKGLAVKIYHQERITERLRAKLELMTENCLDVEGIAWPLLTCENEFGQFVGYIMREVPGGVSLEDEVFDLQSIRTDHPDWTRRTTAAIALDILEKIRFLHSHNVLAGDLKADNILLLPDGHVWLTDCDSFQLAGFPCPVATENFTPPELQNKDCSTFLRSFQNEYFSLAVLLFMTAALPGKSPYAHQGGTTPAENIRLMNFPYPLGESTSQNQPKGTWKCLWSHLPYHLKEAFYCTFKAGEKYASEGNRPDTEFWYRALKRYLDHDLDLMVQNDAMSDSLFPTRFKKHRDMVYAECRECRTEHPADYLGKHGGYCRECYEKLNLTQCPSCGGYAMIPEMKDGMCITCYNRLHTAVCTVCGKTVPETALRSGVCRECMDKPHHTAKCPACPRSFDVTWREHLHNESKGWSDPKYCPDCRRIRKDSIEAYRRKQANRSTPAAPAPVKDISPQTSLRSIMEKLKRL